jgi:hypothetical protein
MRRDTQAEGRNATFKFACSLSLLATRPTQAMTSSVQRGILNSMLSFQSEDLR